MKRTHEDDQVLQMCGLSPGEDISWKDFRDRVRERIILKGIREQICSDCKWNDLCTKKEDDYIRRYGHE